MPLHSYHIFLFPFKWEVFQGKNHQKHPLVERSKLNDMLPKVNLDYWETFTYQPDIDSDDFCNYGEYAYFYDYTRDVLNLNPEYEGVSLKQYRHKGISANSSYHFIVRGKEYTLYLEDVILNLYENGVGVLTLFLQNLTYSEKADIFFINDFGRRIYPQYLGGSPLTAGPKYSFLASTIGVSGVYTYLGSDVVEDFSHYDSLQKLKNQPFVIPKHLLAFLGEDFHTKHPHLQRGEAFISPIIDDRMFTICIYYNQQFLDQLAKKQNQYNESTVYGYQNSQEWYQYIFVDGATSSCYSDIMRQKQLTESTYDRWLDLRMNGKRSGQIFGVSRYSFMVVAAPDDYYNTMIIRKHISHQYFQLVLLSLVQRAYLINFSGEVARISQQLSNKMSLLSKETGAISQLYLLYIKFVNRIFFREITPQEQGIELYDLLQTRMRIRDDVKDLNTEISELSNYVETQQQNRLTWIAGRFLPPTLVAGIFGVNAYNMDGSEFRVDLWWGIALIFGTMLFADYILNFIRFKK